MFSLTIHGKHGTPQGSKPRTNQQITYVPVIARQHKEADRVRESQHVENLQLAFFPILCLVFGGSLRTYEVGSYVYIYTRLPFRMCMT